MVTEKITLKNPEIYEAGYEIKKEKLESAAEAATEKLKAFAKKNAYYVFPATSSDKYKYAMGENKNWECGMYTGCYWLAYQITGDDFFREYGEKQLDTYFTRFEMKAGMAGHDVGFEFMPSVVAAYKLFGREDMKELAIKALEYYYPKQYAQKGRFIIRTTGFGWPDYDISWYRTMMDSLMNASFLFWGTEATGNSEYAKAAIDHVKTTNKLLVRANGSSFHHYQFDPKTEQPLYGATLQGYSADSTWSRGEAWGAYGFPIAYSYSKEDFLVKLSKDIFFYTLNHLPCDLVPNWDYDFVGTTLPRDSSAGVITACGMKELASLLPDTDTDKATIISAAAKLTEAVIDNCTGNPGVPYDGLIHGVTHAYTLDKLHDECAVYGDFFYLEALARHLLPDFKKYW